MPETVTYRGECRGCGRRIVKRLPPTKEHTTAHGIHVRCRECRTISHCLKKPTPDQ